MKKRITLAALVISSVFLFTTMDMQAAPKTMADGTVFDAEFYAETYPDVKEAVGSDETALYDHYVNYGKAEGRKPAVSAGKVAVNRIYRNVTGRSLRIRDVLVEAGLALLVIGVFLGAVSCLAVHIRQEVQTRNLAQDPDQ